MCRIENIEKPLGKLRCFFRFFSIIEADNDNSWYYDSNCWKQCMKQCLCSRQSFGIRRVIKRSKKHCSDSISLNHFLSVSPCCMKPDCKNWCQDRPVRINGQNQQNECKRNPHLLAIILSCITRIMKQINSVNIIFSCEKSNAII